MNNTVFNKRDTIKFDEYWCNVYPGHFIGALCTAKEHATRAADLNAKVGRPPLYRIHVKFKKPLQDTNGAQHRPLH